MIPETWHPFLKDPGEAGRIYDSLTDGFHWEDSNHEDKLHRLLSGILRRAFEKFGAMSSTVFENELRGHVEPFIRRSIHPANSYLSPEQVADRVLEEFNTEVYELITLEPTGNLNPKRQQETVFNVEPLPQSPPPPQIVSIPRNSPTFSAPVERITTRVERQVRDTDLVEKLKKLYGHCCQICEVSIRTGHGRGWYCEAHHIRPLGAPHNGTDDSDNIIIVCPNHHATLDYGGCSINLEELALRRHEISTDNVCYHNEEIVGVMD